MSEQRSVAVIIDYENIHLSLQKNYKKEIIPSKMGVFQEQASKYGVVKKVTAVAKWDEFRRHRDAFVEFGVNPTQVITNHKNASDIAMTVFCMTDLYEENYDVFVIYAGDGGFGPLISALLNKGKEVYLCSVKGCTNGELLTRLQGKHVWLEEEFKESLQEIQRPVVNRLCKEVVKSLHNLYGKQKFPYVTRKYILDKIKANSSTYGTQNEESAGQLLNEARDLNMIFEETAQHTNGDTFTIIKINYSNEIVASIGLRIYNN